MATKNKQAKMMVDVRTELLRSTIGDYVEKAGIDRAIEVLRAELAGLKDEQWDVKETSGKDAAQIQREWKNDIDASVIRYASAIDYGEAIEAAVDVAQRLHKAWFARPLEVGPIGNKKPEREVVVGTVRTKEVGENRRRVAIDFAVKKQDKPVTAGVLEGAADELIRRYKNGEMSAEISILDLEAVLRMIAERCQ